MTTFPEAAAAANKWQAHALPIIKAYFALEDVDMTTAICANHYGKDTMSKQRTSDYREARDHIVKAQDALYDMLEGIRDNFICDYSAPYPIDMSEEELDAADEFNEALGRAVVSVEGAVKSIGDTM